MSDKLIRNIKFSLLFIFFFPPLFFLFILRPLIKINFGVINSDRIGRYVIEFALIKVADQKKQKNEFNFFFLKGKSSNNFFDHLVRRNLNISPIVKYFYMANSEFLKNNEINFNKKHSIDNRDDFGELIKYNFKLEFHETEIKFCQNFLKKIGFKSNQKLICIVIRDKSYLNSIDQSIDWSYHDHRNADIINYVKSVKWLCDNNYFVIRMGKISENKINFKHKNFFDYSQSNLKCDLLDIWLFANCYLCISTGTGVDFVSLISYKPIFFTNYIPISKYISFAKSYTTPKKMFWVKDKIELSLNEYLENNFNSAKLFLKNQITYEDLSEDEILIDLKAYLKLIQSSKTNQSLDYHKIFFNKLITHKYKLQNHINFNIFHDQSFLSSNWYNRVKK